MITTVVHETHAVQAFLTDIHAVVGRKGGYYEFGRFPDPAGDWLIVHAITAQGNSDAGLTISHAHQEFGAFEALMFVGVAGSLKEDILIGSVVIGDYVSNGHSAKVEDTETRGRPKGLPAARELLSASQALIASGEWRGLIRAPAQTELPSPAAYPCKFPPDACIKGIVSGEEVVAGGKSARFAWLRLHYNDCGAVEMEGWGAMNAARYENTPAIVVRGISDMCAGKSHAGDVLHQPIAAAHAAAFAFSILSFQSRGSTAGAAVVGGAGAMGLSGMPSLQRSSGERRVQVVFNFAGSLDEWPESRIDRLVERLKLALGDNEVTLDRIDSGSVRLVMSIRERDLTELDLSKLREVARESGAALLGAVPLGAISGAEEARRALALASSDLLGWEKTLPHGGWIERPEQKELEARLELESSSTVLLGPPGSGKSALLSKIATDLVERGSPVLAVKADFLSPDVKSEADLQHELSLPALPSELVLRLAALQPVYVLIDQLDALASQLDLRSGRLNVLLNFVRRVARSPNVHVLLSARTFEFNHDVRLRTIDAESVVLQLPPWHEVKERLSKVGIEADGWPEKAREVVRIPQALKTFVALVQSGRKEPFGTYQAMLEQFWHERVASSEDSAGLSALASDLAGTMAEEETLWLAAARFDDRASLLRRLEALGFIVRSENKLSVSFSHQTIFEHVLARSFVGRQALLARYVLERQDSLFVRSKLWSALHYLRGAEIASYERELRHVWETRDLRRHLRLLLIEFIGQVSEPTTLEVAYMSDVLNSAELRVFGLKAIAYSEDWFPHFAHSAIRQAMSGTDTEASLASQILAGAWRTNESLVLRLIRECWLQDPQKDAVAWMTLRDCPTWTHEVEEAAKTVLQRSAIAAWSVADAAMTLAVTQPDVALRLLRAKLEFWLAEVEAHDEGVRRRDLLDSREWDELPSLAEASPEAFIDILWPWYLSLFSAILARRNQEEPPAYLYPGRYSLEVDLHPGESRSQYRDRPLLDGIQTAIEELAKRSPARFLTWANENSTREVLIVQQLIARGFEITADTTASRALEWILADVRRFQLGTVYGLRETTIGLIDECAPHWTGGEVRRFEEAVHSYRPEVPKHLTDPEHRKTFADLVRATKKDLLKALGLERLKPESRELVVTEQRALGDRFDWEMRLGEGGFIGSPMGAEAMAKAKDRDVLKIFREIPDKTDWDHPKDWARGGNIQLSREFAEFARAHPERATRLIEQFEPGQQERAAGYALDAMAKDGRNDERVLEAFLDLHSRGFSAPEFRESAARAIQQIAQRRNAGVSDAVIEVLESWLEGYEAAQEVADSDESENPASGELRDQSLLWGLGGAITLPSGNYTFLSTLATILLNRKEAGRDRYFSILEDHLARERDPRIWKALLQSLSNVGGATPQVASAFFRKLFSRFPQIFATREGAMFLAYAQRWDDRLVFDLIAAWRTSDQPFCQRAYGELVGLVSTTKQSEDWARARDDIVVSGPEEMKIGLAHAAVNLRGDEGLRHKADQVLIALLKEPTRRLVAVVIDLFRIADELTPDPSTVQLLRALSEPEIDLSGAPSTFVVEHLQSLLPHEADLIATLAGKLVQAWRGELGDIRTERAAAAPQLTDLALTLHRIGGSSRQSGVQLFEAMIEIDAHGARETLAEIDGRFTQAGQTIRRRVARRPKRPRRRVSG